MGVLLRRRIREGALLTFALSLLLLSGESRQVYAAPETFEEIRAFSETEDENIVELEWLLSDYIVETGDSLWSIAEECYGNGEEYLLLYEANQDQIADPNRIYPGMALQCSRFLQCEQSKPLGFQTPKYSFDTYNEWRVGTSDMGKSWANFSWWDPGGYDTVNCLIRDKRHGSEDTLEDWTDCQQRIEAYVEETYGPRVSNLTFERFRTRDGEDLYLYHFTYEVTPEQTGLEESAIMEVCMGIRLTDTIQAEFLYYGDNTGFSQVLYMAGTFREEEGMEEDSIDDDNMQLHPEVEWPLQGLFNPFGWLDAAFDVKEPEETPLDMFEQPLPRRSSDHFDN